jgi:hypothetical protein
MKCARSIGAECLGSRSVAGGRAPGSGQYENQSARQSFFLPEERELCPYCYLRRHAEHVGE